MNSVIELIAELPCSSGLSSVTAAPAQHTCPCSFTAHPEFRQQSVLAGSIGQTCPKGLLTTHHHLNALSFIAFVLHPGYIIYVMQMDVKSLHFLRDYPG